MEEQLTTACCSSLPSSSSSSPRTSGSPKRFSAARFSLSSSSSSHFFSLSRLVSKMSLESKFSAFAVALLLFFPFLKNEIHKSWLIHKLNCILGVERKKFGEWGESYQWRSPEEPWRQFARPRAVHSLKFKQTIVGQIQFDRTVRNMRPLLLMNDSILWMTYTGEYCLWRLHLCFSFSSASLRLSSSSASSSEKKLSGRFRTWTVDAEWSIQETSRKILEKYCFIKY